VIRDVRRAVLPELVRVTIELDDEVAYRQERLDGPPRVFFDLEGTVPSPGLQNAILTWQDDVVRQVRMGRPSATTTRVVLDLEGASRYSVFTLYSPYRLVIDVERASGKRAGVQPSVPRPTVERETKSASVAPPAAPQALEPAVPASTRPLVADLDLVPQPARPRVDPREIDGKDLGLDRDPALTSRAIDPDSGVSPASPGRAATAPTPAPELPPSPRTPAANSNGTFSLARQLGLGISRIVIDPGHGGHDPGALGKGISEANLVLDVALRLEKLLLKRPGAEVVLTRRADTFVALEERTAIANREKADLFLSIHVNASRNAKAQGVETYFLNFATSPEAEAVAARENSASGRTMHNLPDIVRAITLNNKLDESRDLARVVQDSLVKRLGAQHRQLRDLGVKQAPFVVLIGAAMPSVLAEIAFITNPREAQLLKSEAYRQRIAEALLDAVTRYQRSLKSVGAVAAQ
jgi:N-acetylmuramoyl-L-alanine amidase